MAPPRATCRSRHRRRAAAVLEPALGGRIAQDADRRAGARRHQRAALHGLRHRTLRHRREGRQRHREFRTRRPRRPTLHQLHVLLQLHRHHARLPAELGTVRPVHHHQSLRHREHHGHRRDRPAIPPRRRGLLSSTTPNPTGSTVPIGCAGIGDPLEAVWNSPTFTAVPPPVRGRPAAGGRSRAVRPVFALRQSRPARRLHHRRHRLFRARPPARPIDTDPGPRRISTPPTRATAAA